MNWLLLAVAGHLLNGVAFVVDKTLLSSTFKRSATYAILISVFSLSLAILLPWVSMPEPRQWLLLIGFGGLNTLGLWCFFEALRRAEASRVVPIIGSVIPLITLAGTSVFLGERLTNPELAGLALLVSAIVLLTSGRSARITWQTFGIILLGALLFAASSVLGKAAYEQLDFVSTLSLGRILAGCTGLLILLVDIRARQEIKSIFFSKTRNKERKPRGVLAKTIFAQLAGASGFILVNAAISMGSAVLVNALQAVQYAFLVLIAWFGGTSLRALLQEEVNRSVVARKGLAILLTAAGLALISHLF